MSSAASDLQKNKGIERGLTWTGRFPKQSKDAIKDTLTVVAERVGTREKDKRWVVKR